MVFDDIRPINTKIEPYAKKRERRGSWGGMYPPHGSTTFYRQMNDADLGHVDTKVHLKLFTLSEIRPCFGTKSKRDREESYQECKNKPRGQLEHRSTPLVTYE